jgi:regulator of protease activity HflC (stomatin/prohibitin superfamily)
LVKQPILPFFAEGVDPTPVKTGRTYVMWTTKAVKVNVQPVQYPVHFDDLMSSDGVPLDFDSIIRLRVLNSVVLIKDFGVDWYNSNIKSEFMNRVRQAVRNHGMNETAINSKAIDAIDNEVSLAMNEYIKSAKIPVQLMQVTIGKANPPDSIKNQRVETAAQQQRILTEQQRKLAEDSRKSAEQSRAAADNAYREAMGLNPAQYLQLEQIKMLREVGVKGGNTFIIGGGATPVIDVKK